MPPNHEPDEQKPPSINSIAVSGFKSIATEQTIEVRPLTLLAGANSSGKSSIMQAVLLLKQTLEASYDPGPLLLNGPNVRLTSVDQMLFHSAGKKETTQLLIRIGLRSGRSFEVVLGRESGKKLDIQRCTYAYPDTPPMVLTQGMSASSLLALLPFDKVGHLPVSDDLQLRILRDRCFLRPAIDIEIGSSVFNWWSLAATAAYSKALQEVIHLPGLRGNPERAYPLTSTGPKFPGTFETYTAALVAEWSHNDSERLEQLGRDCNTLGLTWKVEAKGLDDARVELRVGRLRSPRRGGANDLVNIADVGFGVSQTLPVLVALLAAQPGQLLYIEQPEIHLHPRAQVAMASLLARAALRGVRLVVETHSALLLLGVQSEVAEQKLPPDQVKLHWFTRSDTTGATTITSADLDEAGRFGDWPEDFDDVTLKAQAHYLDAAEALLAKE